MMDKEVLPGIMKSNIGVTKQTYTSDEMNEDTAVILQTIGL